MPQKIVYVVLYNYTKHLIIYLFSLVKYWRAQEQLVPQKNIQ